MQLKEKENIKAWKYSKGLNYLQDDKLALVGKSLNLRETFCGVIEFFIWSELPMMSRRGKKENMFHISFGSLPLQNTFRIFG